MRQSLYNNAVVIEAMAYATKTTGANNGISIDLASYKNNFRDVLFIVNAEGSGDSGTHTFTVEESANNSNWAASARTQGTLPVINTDNDNQVHIFGCQPSNRYVRIVDTAASASSGLAFSAVAVLTGGSDHPPGRS